MGWLKKTRYSGKHSDMLFKIPNYILITSGIKVMPVKRKLIFGEKRKTVKPMQFLQLVTLLKQ